MTSLPTSLLRAAGQLTDPPVLRVLAKSVAATLAIFLVLGIAGGYGLDAVFDASGFEEDYGLSSLLAALLTVLAAWLLFRIVALAVLSGIDAASSTSAALLLLFTGIGPALLFWAVNAWLLGRELTDMVWLRHRPKGPSAADIRAPVGRTERFLLGGVIAALLAVPFVNFIAPVLGAAAATHLVHRRLGNMHAT